MSVALDLFLAPPVPSELPAGPARPELVPPRLRLVPDVPDVLDVPGVSGGPEGARPGSSAVPQLAPRPAYLRPPAGREAVAPLRLTRRGVAVLAVLVAGLGGALVWLAALSAPDVAATPTVPASIAVRSGDTLWAIASRYAGDRDPRAVVASIQQRNHLDGVSLVPGQVLRLR